MSDLWTKFNEEREEEKDHDLKLVVDNTQKGGKEPPNTSNCWLDNLPIGACFLVKKKTDLFDENLALFRIDKRTEKAVIMNSPMIPQRLYFDPIAFSNKWRLFEDLGLMIEEQELTNDSNRNAVDGDGKEDQVE